jgi:hypothetical protein
MSVNFGTGWYVYSLQKLQEDKEKGYVRWMIANSNNATVRLYASSTDGGQVYVKSGRHVSDFGTARAHQLATWVRPNAFL